MAIQAGADMALISSDAGAVPSVVAALRSALEDGTLPRARVAEALAHIDAALRTLAR
jgi:beta-glucosidase-like glycosyl hydrolase